MAVENENKLNEIIQAFADAGFINDVILIGSWCLSFYVEVFEGFVPSVRTTDIDFYVPDSKRANTADLSDRLRSTVFEPQVINGLGFFIFSYLFANQTLLYKARMTRGPLTG